MTDLDAKHSGSRNLSMESVPHAEFVDTPVPQVNVTPRSSNELRKETADARDPPLSPGHTNCAPRVTATLSRAVSTTSDPNHSKQSQPISPITAVATPVTTPSTRDQLPPKLHTQERTARHSRGMPLHEDINNLFSFQSSSLFRSSSPSDSSSPDSEC